MEAGKIWKNGGGWGGRRGNSARGWVPECPLASNQLRAQVHVRKTQGVGFSGLSPGAVGFGFRGRVFRRRRGGNPVTAPTRKPAVVPVEGL